MMSKTHITIGVASSLAVCQPTTLEGIFAAVIGGAAGGILCDIDCHSTSGMRDALWGRLIVLGLCVLVLLADWIMKAGIWISILSQSPIKLIIGCVILAITCLIGSFCEHRTFTHSILFCALITFGFYCITPLLLIPVAIGGLSHLIIDTLNKKPIPWLFPLQQGICLKLFYAGKVANTVFMWVGLAACIGLLIWRVMLIT